MPKPSNVSFDAISPASSAKRLDGLLSEAVDYLLADKPLPARYVDHTLVGEWKDYRDCHIHPDLVLIYRKLERNVPELARLGSHSALGL